MLKKVFGRATAVAPDEAACLAICRAGVGKDVLAPFEGSSELPAGGDEEETTLLMRYLRAEKLDAVKALSRLQKQSAWRKGFGRVEEVRFEPHTTRRRRYRTPARIGATCVPNQFWLICCLSCPVLLLRRRTLLPSWLSARSSCSCQQTRARAARC